MKKILPLVLFSLAIGLAIPFLAGYKQFYYFLAVLFFGVLFFITRKKEVTVYDFLILFIIFIPFHHFRLGTGKFFVRLTELPFIPLFLLWVTQASLNKNLRTKFIFREHLILAFFIILSSLSIAKSLYPIISIYRTLTLTYMIVFSFIVSDIIKEKERLFSIIKTLLIVSGLAGILGILQSFFPSFSLFYKVSPHASIGPIRIYRATCGWDNPNYFALFLSVIIPITIGLLLSKQFKEKMFLKICLFLQMLGLISTYSRNGAISVTAAFLFLLWFLRKKMLTLTILTIIIVLISSIWIGKEYLYENNTFLYAFFFRIPLEQVKEDPQIVAGFRWDVWRANINMFLDNPFLGVGPFMAVENYWHYRPSKTIWQSELGNPHPHNEYISLLSERGIFSFFLFVAFLIMLIRRGVIVFKNNRNTQLGAISLGLTAGAFSFLVAGLGEATINDVAFWVVVGLLLATYKIIQNE
ncbi:O-antigen ligase family protein [Candidatus Omnitrophota bacterium]